MAAMENTRSGGPHYPASVKNLVSNSTRHARIVYGTVADAEEYRKWLDSHGLPQSMHIDAALIRTDKWAVRHPSSFFDVEFDELQDSIEKAGGNDNPVLVRPIRSVAVGSSNFGKVLWYAVIFGERRYRACFLKSTPVFVTIEEATDEEHYKLKLRDHVHRKAVCAYEMGLSYVLVLRGDENGKGKLFARQQDLANHLGTHKSMVSDGVKLGLLPSLVVHAFPQI